MATLDTRSLSGANIHGLNDEVIRSSLDALARDHTRIQRALDRVGYPESRQRDQGFATLARIVVGQQVSVAAAASINRKLEALLNHQVTAEAVLTATESDLRSVGLSRQKTSYLQCLATAEATGQLQVDLLPDRTDAEVVEAITAIKGFGEWSAQMYLMFSLGRTDVWPVGDLAVREGLRRILGLEQRPTPGECRRLGEPYSPHRSAFALLCWRFCDAEPLQ